MFQVLKLSDFKNSKPTTVFLKIINFLCDILYNRQPFSSLCKDNYNEIITFVNNAIKYFTNLRFPNGTLAVEHRRKTPFIGMIVTFKNIEYLYRQYIENDKFSFILTQTLHQNHLDAFINSFKIDLGFDKCPNVKQFTIAYKQLIKTADICVSENFRLIRKIENQSFNPINEINDSLDKIGLLKSCNRKPFDENQFLMKHKYMLNVHQLTDNITKILYYISGYIVYHLSKLILCQICVSIMNENWMKKYSFSEYIKIPSDDVVNVCALAENSIRKYLQIKNNNISSKILMQIVVIDVETKILHNNQFKLFDKCKEHFLSNNHYCLLIKCIVEKYFQIRFFYLDLIDSKAWETVKFLK